MSYNVLNYWRIKCCKEIYGRFSSGKILCHTKLTGLSLLIKHFMIGKVSMLECLICFLILVVLFFKDLVIARQHTTTATLLLIFLIVFVFLTCGFCFKIQLQSVSHHHVVSYFCMIGLSVNYLLSQSLLEMPVSVKYVT